jgi:hypothetical protein
VYKKPQGQIPNAYSDVRTSKYRKAKMDKGWELRSRLQHLCSGDLGAADRQSLMSWFAYKVDVIVAGGLSECRAAKQAGLNMPPEVLARAIVVIL